MRGTEKKLSSCFVRAGLRVARPAEITWAALFAAAAAATGEEQKNKQKIIATVKMRRAAARSRLYTGTYDWWTSAYRRAARKRFDVATWQNAPRLKCRRHRPSPARPSPPARPPPLSAGAYKYWTRTKESGAPRHASCPHRILYFRNVFYFFRPSSERSPGPRTKPFSCVWAESVGGRRLHLVARRLRLQTRLAVVQSRNKPARAKCSPRRRRPGEYYYGRKFLRPELVRRRWKPDVFLTGAPPRRHCRPCVNYLAYRNNNRRSVLRYARLCAPRPPSPPLPSAGTRYRCEKVRVDLRRKEKREKKKTIKPGRREKPRRAVSLKTNWRGRDGKKKPRRVVTGENRCVALCYTDDRRYRGETTSVPRVVVIKQTALREPHEIGSTQPRLGFGNLVRAGYSITFVNRTAKNV